MFKILNTIYNHSKNHFKLLLSFLITMTCMSITAHSQLRMNDGIFNSYLGSSIQLQVGDATQASITSDGLFDISGTLIISDGGETCDATIEGALRYSSSSTEHDYCDGSNWAPLSGGVDSVTGEPAPNFNFLLNSVTDVNLTSVTGGECLVYDGAEWVNSTSCANGIDSVTGASTPIQVEDYANIEVVSGAATPAFENKLGDLNDVASTAPSNGNVLTWATASSSWEPSATVSTQSLWTDETTHISRTGIVLIGGTLGIGGITSPSVELDVSGSIVYTGTIADLSDKRLKDNIMTLPKEQLENINNINAVSFVMKNNSSVVEYGVIAQELEEIFPTLVQTANDKMKTKSVNYIGLIAPMVSAIQELKAENEALRIRLNALESK